MKPLNYRYLFKQNPFYTSSGNVTDSRVTIKNDSMYDLYIVTSDLRKFCISKYQETSISILENGNWVFTLEITHWFEDDEYPSADFFIYLGKPQHLTIRKKEIGFFFPLPYVEITPKEYYY